MRMARGAATIVLAGALVTATTAAASPGPVPEEAVRWTPALEGEAVRVELIGGTLRLAASPPGGTTTESGSEGDVHQDEPLGLLTLPAHRLDAPVNRVDAALDASGGGVSVDVRGKRPNGKWTEWTTTEPSSATGGTATAALPAPATQVQARIVFTRDAGPGTQVHGLALTAHPARDAGPPADPPPVSYRVFATREGLIGGTTANGHVIGKNDLFVALPSRRALSPRDSSDYSVKVCAPTGRCAYAPVWDVGPWNTHDDYWSPAHQRENWRGLPEGVPQAQAATRDGHNGGKDQFGRTVRNPAGIDLSDALFSDALGMTSNDWVTVDYLWTGRTRLAAVRAEGGVQVRAARNATARIVALAANGAGVPLQCATTARDGRWLRIGPGQFLPAAAVPQPETLLTCEANHASTP
jgi:hypothetical protein